MMYARREVKYLSNWMELIQAEIQSIRGKLNAKS